MAAGDDRAGHRERLRERLLKSDEALPDYELLELILFNALPRGDTKPLAKALIKRFGSFAAVMRAPAEEIMGIPGCKGAVAAALRLADATARRLARADIQDRTVLSNWESLLSYLQVHLGPESREQFRVIYLDAKNGVIADELQQRGTVNHAPVYPREVVTRALQIGASALILVHNHPSGDTRPSKADIEMTRLVKQAAEALNIALHDHLIVGRKGHSSFKQLGLL